MIYRTKNPLETQQLAKSLAQKYPKGGIFALFGPLGSGKTTFIQGFALGLGISQRIISPTFVLMKQYDLPNQPGRKLIHLDLYRLEEIKQVEHLGIKEIFNNPGSFILIEWADRLGKLLPQGAVSIKLKKGIGTIREIAITN